MDAETFALHEDQAKGAVFTASRVSDRYILDGIYADLSGAIEEGGTLDAFIEQMDERMDRKGVDGKGDFYWETVFRNNVQASYAAGRWERQQATRGSRPYLEYVAVMDSATRPAHKKFNGVIRHIDDGFWATHYPLNGHRCRCTTRSHSKAGLDKLGRAPTTDEEIPELTPDPGFAGNPGSREGARAAATSARSQLTERGLGATGRNLSRADDAGRVKSLQGAFPGGGEGARSAVAAHPRVMSPTAPRAPEPGEVLVSFSFPSQSPELLDAQLVKMIQNPGLYPHRASLRMDSVVGVQRWDPAWQNPEVALERHRGSLLGYSSQTRASIALPVDALPHLEELWRGVGVLSPEGLTIPGALKSRWPWMDADIAFGEGVSGALPDGFGWAWRVLTKQENGWLEQISVAPVTGAPRVAVNLGVLRYLEGLQ